MQKIKKFYFFFRFFDFFFNFFEKLNFFFFRVCHCNFQKCSKWPFFEKIQRGGSLVTKPEFHRFFRVCHCNRLQKSAKNGQKIKKKLQWQTLIKTRFFGSKNEKGTEKKNNDFDLRSHFSKIFFKVIVTIQL